MSQSPELVENDWITNFFDKCRTVSDSDMQRLWAYVLATEANSPGSFSRKTVNLIADLDRSDAEMFGRLCSFGWEIESFTPLVFDFNAKIYIDNGVDFESVNRLENLGLLHMNGGIGGYAAIELPKSFTTNYFGQSVTLTLQFEAGNRLRLGYVILTQAGQQLAPFCGSNPLPDFLRYVTDVWTHEGLSPLLSD